MARKMAAALALVVFAVCVIAGMGAGNPFETVLSKALVAMAATFVIGLVVGAMAQKMLDENLGAEAAKQLIAPEGEVAAGAGKEKSGNPERKPEAKGR
jgi:hypothetical protein